VAAEHGPEVVALDAAGLEWVTIGPQSQACGWSVYHSPRFGVSPRRPVLFLRLGLGEATGGHPLAVVRDLWVSDASGLGARALRDLPITRIEAAVNQPLHAAAVRARAAPAGAPAEPFPWPTGVPPAWWRAAPRAREAPPVVLAVPERQPKPDSFYRAVADAFAHLTTTSTRPAAVLAEANGVPVTQVHGWVKEARRRSLLPAGERSRRGR